MKKRFSAKVLVVAIVVALLGTMLIGPTAASAAAPTNIVPADVFAGPDKVTQWFERGSTDAADYTKDGNDYVMHVKTVNSAWMYSNQTIPFDTYTIRLYIQPIEYEKDGIMKHGGMGMVLGYGAQGNGFPWMDVRVDYNIDGAELVDFYVWEHLGAKNAMVKRFGGEWYDDYGMPSSDWMEVIFEVTPTETNMYIDGWQVPDISTEAEHPSWADTTLGHLPTSSELQWFGFFSEGSTEGFNVKNFGIYEGIGLFQDDVEDLTEEPTQEPSDDPTEEPTQEPSDDPTQEPDNGGYDDGGNGDGGYDDGGNDGGEGESEPKEDKGGSNVGLIIGIVAAVVVLAAAAVVVVIIVLKKKK